MPLYEYECRDCAERFEKLVSLSEARRAQKCPGCGSRSVRRLMSAIATVRKESGGIGECPTCSTGTCEL